MHALHALVLFLCGIPPLFASPANSANNDPKYIICQARTASASGPMAGKGQLILESKIFVDPAAANVTADSLKAYAAQFEAWLDKHPVEGWPGDIRYKYTDCGNWPLDQATEMFKLSGISQPELDWPSKGSSIRSLPIKLPDRYYWLCFGRMFGANGKISPDSNYESTVTDIPRGPLQSEVEASFSAWVGARSPGEGQAASRCFAHYKREEVEKTAAGYAAGAAMGNFKRADFEFSK